MWALTQVNLQREWREEGGNLVRWCQDNMAVWAVSDLERDQFVEFAKLWQAAS